jgi:putative ABC transport system permease protein
MEATAVALIPLGRLSLALIPVAGVVLLLLRWSLDSRGAMFATIRMLAQLSIVGFGLVFIFESDTPWIVMGILMVMVTVSAWIGLRTVPSHRSGWYGRAWLAISLGGGLTFVLVTQFVLDLEPWYYARYTVPLAGMIFSNAMTSVSLAAERLNAEQGRGVDYEDARRVALTAALIPITNSMLAVGLVSLPGMMTGQILSGVDPLLAVRYQIMVMCMIYGSSGLTAALFLMAVRESGVSHEGPAS